MTKLYGPINSGDTAGGAGTSTANASSTNELHGMVLAVYVKYNGSPPAGTTDVVVKTVGTSPAPPSLSFLTLTNAATDGYFYPRTIAQDLVGATTTYDGTNEIYTPVVIHDKINVNIAQANDGDSIDVWILLK